MRKYAIFLIMLAVPFAWSIQMGFFYHSVFRPPQDIESLIGRACGLDDKQLIWIETAHFQKKMSCDDVQAAMASGVDIRLAELILTRTRAPTFMLLETLVQCTYVAAEMRHVGEVKCKTFTDGI